MKKLKVKLFIWRGLAIIFGSTLLSLHWAEFWSLIWNTIKGFWGG